MGVQGGGARALGKGRALGQGRGQQHPGVWGIGHASGKQHSGVAANGHQAGGQLAVGGMGGFGVGYAGGIPSRPA